MRSPTAIRNLLTCPRKRDAWWMVIGFLLAFAVADRVLDRIRFPRVGALEYASTNGSRWKWELYERAESTPNVVFLGSSYGMNGISPTAVDERVRELTGRSIRSLNLCARRAGMFTQHLLIRRMVECGRLPEVVYIGVSPRGTVQNADTDTSGFLWLASGLRALGDARDLKVAASVNRGLLDEGVRTTLFSSYRYWRDCRLIAKLVMRGAPLQPKTRLHYDDRGWARWVGENRPREVDDDALRPTPASPEALDWSADNNPNGKALREAVTMLREAGVTVRLLEMPLRSTAPPAAQPGQNPVYREFLENTLLQLRASVVRPPAGLLADSDFFDNEHLGAEGALKLSRWLAGDVAAALTARR